MVLTYVLFPCRHHRPLIIAINTATLDLTAVYIIRSFRTHWVTEESLDSVAAYLGFEDSVATYLGFEDGSSVLFNAATQYCLDKNYISQEEDRIRVTTTGLYFVNDFATQWGAQFGWGQAYNHDNMRGLVAHVSLTMVAVPQPVVPQPDADE